MQVEANSVFEQEYQYYKSHEADLVRQHEGKYIGIVGEQVVGVFESELEAYMTLKKKYGLGKFMLQQAVPVATDRIQRYHSRVAFR
jgi:hypothetical protein